MAHCLQHTPPFGPFWGSFGHECYRSRYDWCTLPLLFVAASVPQCPASRRQLLLPASRRGLPFFPITLCMRSGTSSELLVPFPALPCHSQPHHTPAGAQGKVVPSSAPLLATGRRACSCLPPKHSLRVEVRVVRISDGRDLQPGSAGETWRCWLEKVAQHFSPYHSHMT